MKTTFNWGDNTIDSRSIIERHEELQDEFNALVESFEEAKLELENIKGSESSLAEFQDAENEVGEAQEALDQFNQSYDKDELDTLTQVIAEGEDSPDWNHGETLIHETHFSDYIKDIIDDCYEMPKEFESGKWPWNHMEMDWDGAAEEALSDYFEINVDGSTYYIRS
jgi:hypothetical protein